MNYSVYFLLILGLTSSYSFGMAEVIALLYHPSEERSVPAGAIEVAILKPKTTQEMIEHVPTFQMSQQVKVSPEEERKHATFFIDCLKNCKSIAKGVLDEDPKQLKLSDKQVSWLNHYMLAMDSDSIKAESNSGAVYRKMCSLHLDSPDDVRNTIKFWHTLLSKEKMSDSLYRQQIEQIKKLHNFFHYLKKRGIILQYPRTVDGKIIYKAAL